MTCVGIFIDADAMRSLFNYELALLQGRSLIQRTDFGGDPEYVRRQVEVGLRRSHPHVVVRFWDPNSELEIETPEQADEYSLIIHQEAPIYSTHMH
jgi:hypothetical protein